MRAFHFATLTLLLGCAIWIWQQFSAQPTVASPEPIQCVSYSPFYQGSNPLDPNTHIPREQIQQDLRLLSKQFPCVRTYSVALGLDAVPEIAQSLGMQVYLGIWIGWVDSINREQITRAIQLSRQYPKTIKALVVGNEVLLRGEQKPNTMREYFRLIKQATSTPITYADVWEFWRMHKELAEEVDFITVHILPYWENNPVAIQDAEHHVEAVMQLLQQEFKRPILIGETGWPAQGRQRFGAEPSLRNQVQYMQSFLQLAHQHGWRYNLIEAFDQPWKRNLEGTVGGYWGMYDVDGQPKFTLGQAVAERNDPLLLAALLGLSLLMVAIFLRTTAPSRATQQVDLWHYASVFSLSLMTALTLYLQVHYVWVACRNYSEWMALISFSAIAFGLLLMNIYLLIFREIKYKVEVFYYHARWMLIALALYSIVTSALLILDGRYRNFPNQIVLLPVLISACSIIFLPKPALWPQAGMVIARSITLGLSLLLVFGAADVLKLEPNNCSAQLWCLINIVLAGLLLTARSSAEDSKPPAALHDERLPHSGNSAA